MDMKYCKKDQMDMKKGYVVRAKIGSGALPHKAPRAHANGMKRKVGSGK